MLKYERILVFNLTLLIWICFDRLLSKRCDVQVRNDAMSFNEEKPLSPQVIYTLPRRVYGDEMANISTFFDYVLHPSVLCQESMSVGGQVINLQAKDFPQLGDTLVTDGNKMVCLDHAFGFDRQNCVIYSFGINHEWSFDDQMDRMGCKVFAFDPSMNVGEHRRGNNINFYPLGVAGEDMIAEHFNNAELKTMPSIVKMLGHQNIDIDYMKIDVEGAEVALFEQMLDNNPEILDKFKQIGMEIHPRRYTEDSLPNYIRLFKMFMRMEKRGYRLIFTNPNPMPFNFYYLEEVGQVVNGFYELVWVKVPPE